MSKRSFKLLSNFIEIVDSKNPTTEKQVEECAVMFYLKHKTSIYPYYLTTYYFMAKGQ